MQTPAADRIELVIFDWAGTVVDHGSLAPVRALQRVFEHRGLRLVSAHAREPMGQSKRAHIESLLAMPEIALQWQRVLARPVSRADVESMYRDFQVTLLSLLPAHSRLTPGALDALRWLRARRTRVAVTTGYFREAAEAVLAAAGEQGFVPDWAVCADDVSAGRPAPWMIYACMEALQVFPPSRVVVVGDTPADMQAARNAGCHAVALTVTGNEVGLAERDWAALDQREQRTHIARARAALRQAGAQIVLDTLAELPAAIDEIELRSRPGPALLHAVGAAAQRLVRSHARPPHATMGADS